VGGSPFLWELPFLLGRLPKEKVAKGFSPAFPVKSSKLFLLAGQKKVNMRFYFLIVQKESVNGFFLLFLQKAGMVFIRTIRVLLGFSIQESIISGLT